MGALVLSISINFVDLIPIFGKAKKEPSSMALKETNFKFPGQRAFYRGKVRDVYSFDRHMAIVVTDRISAFDHILPMSIPFKGQILNTIAARFLKDTEHIVPNWLEHVPHPNVSIGKICQPIKLEMVIRAHLTGHAWRTFRDGGRTLCGVVLPEGMRQNDPFSYPILTPATKADEGHDEDISEQEILEQDIVSASTWKKLKEISFELFHHGQKMAEERDLILVDTKYEFGWFKGEIYLIDEVHTPDSSRYFYRDGFKERQNAGQAQKHLSKEFVREWLMHNGFQGLKGQKMPTMTNEVVEMISDRYKELYQQLIGKKFEPHSTEDIESSILKSLA